LSDIPGNIISILALTFTGYVTLDRLCTHPENVFLLLHEDDVWLMFCSFPSSNAESKVHVNSEIRIIESVSLNRNRENPRWY
jgi:hypothetical protein